MKWKLIFKSLLTCFLVLLLLSKDNHAFGEDSFSLEEAVEYGINNSNELANARLQREIASQQVRETRARGLPQLDGSLNLEHYPSRPVQLVPAEFMGGQPGEFVELSFGTDFDLGASLTLSQLIFDGQFFVALSAAREFKDLRDKEADETRRNVRETITKAYYSAVLARESKDILEDNIQELQQTLEETEVLFENGFVEQLDVDRIRLRLNQVVTEHENARRRHSNALQALKLEMGYPVNEDLSTEKGLEEYKDETDDLQQIPPEQVIYDRIEHDILKSREAVTHLDRRRYRAGYLPEISAFASHRQNAQRDEFNFFETGQSWFEATTIGLSINVPLFDGFRKNALIQQKNLELAQVDNQRFLLEQSIYAELEEAMNNFESAQEQLQNQEENLSLARSIYEQTLEKYREGVGESRDVTEAQTDMNQAQLSYLNAVLDLLTAEIDYKLANGTF